MDSENSDIRSRLGKIEDRLNALEQFAVEARQRLDQTATKADLAELSATLIKWIVGMAFGMGVAGVTIMTFVLNNAVTKAPMAAPPAPVVIQLPPYR